MSIFDKRRYLSDFDSTRMGHIVTDLLVVGSGVAGARAALAASEFGSVVVLTKAEAGESATGYAQGGIAAAVDPSDTPDAHFADTVRVGAGLNRAAAVRRLVDEAAERVRELIDWGWHPDRVDGALQLGREGGHGVNRIVHADGDWTGRELVRVLRERIASSERIRLFEHCFMVDLLVVDGACHGAVTFHEKYGHQLIWAKQTILASGGCGRIWRETTNPPIATGDGHAAAFRAGARLCDMEMMQFHPTTLYVAGAGRALISEAVRGEGAYLVDQAGERFMEAYHPDRELAPRDVVSRAIRDHLHKTDTNSVFLDVRHIAGFAERFPQIDALCKAFEIDPAGDRIPVRPSAHYMIGGVDVDLDGRASVAGLWACGEAACSGVHGANRIASNSLLEGLVFGAVAGREAGRAAASLSNGVPVHRVQSVNQASPRTELDLSDIHNSLRSVMWRNVGVARHEQRLRETCDILAFWAHYVLDKRFNDVTGWQVQNQLTVGHLVATAALARNDSIGVHYRADSPAEGQDSRYHLTLTRHDHGTRVERLIADDAVESPLPPGGG